MTALTAARNTPQRAGDILGYPVKASVKPIQGGIAVLSAGYAAPATTATGLIAVGRFEETVDNTSGADGALSVQVRRGTFRFGNSASGDLPSPRPTPAPTATSSTTRRSRKPPAPTPARSPARSSPSIATACGSRSVNKETPPCKSPPPY
jgi:hypothetical protein